MGILDRRRWRRLSLPEMAPFLAAADKRLPPPVHLHIARLGEQALQILEQPDFKPDLNHPGFEGYTFLALYPPFSAHPTTKRT